MPMRKWIIDFDGYAIVGADTREEAETALLLDIEPSVESPILTTNINISNIESYEPVVRQLSMFDTDN